MTLEELYAERKKAWSRIKEISAYIAKLDFQIFIKEWIRRN